MKYSHYTHIEAMFHLKPTSEGGRATGIGAGYRPHLVVPPSSEYLGIQLVKVFNPKSDPLLNPGESKQVCFFVLYPDTISYADLVVGASFEIREGENTVGTGEVLSVSESIGWKPKSPLVIASDLPALSQNYPVLVVHCGAAWNGIDVRMDEIINKCRDQYADIIGFYAVDIDNLHNWEWADEVNILNLPALIGYVQGKRQKAVIGMPPLDKLRVIIDGWLALVK